VVFVVKAVPPSRVRPAVNTSPVAPAKLPVPLLMRPIPENVPVPVPCGGAGSTTDTSLIVRVPSAVVNVEIPLTTNRPARSLAIGSNASAWKRTFR